MPAALAWKGKEEQDGTKLAKAKIDATNAQVD
jgi:hypothetical protein